MRQDALTEAMRRLALEAGARIMEIYGEKDLGVEAKADSSPVTRADLAADAIIGAGLAEAFPDVPVVTEERAESHTVSADRFLIVDPLDGTKEFVHRRGDFTVNIALVEGGVPRRGVVYAPAKGRLFITDADGRAFEETGGFGEAPGEIREIRAAAPDGPLKVVASKSHRDAATEAYIDRHDHGGFESAGSSLKFCLVATGEAHLYPRLGRTMEWDTAAGDAVLRAAGGTVIRFDDHTPLRYGKPGYENPFFIAHAPGVEPARG